VQTLEDSSFDTWIKYYRQDENSPNSQVSYYTKGALAGLCLDLHIRRETKGAKSLDDVMIALWQRFGRDFYAGKSVGVGETEWEQVAEQVTGLKLKPMFDALLRSTQSMPLAESVGFAGVQWQERAQLAASDKGGWVEAPKPPSAWLGARTATDAGGLVKLTQVLIDGPAMLAGLAANDVLVAIDGLKANGANLDAALMLAKPGSKLEVLAFRRDELMKFKVELEAAPSNTIGLKRSEEDTMAAARRKAWLGQ
jgi:predicted metalloprotease with PDZ domain